MRGEGAGWGNLGQNLLLVVAIVCALGMTYYYHEVLIPIRQQQSHLEGAAEGNWSDLYPLWIATHDVLLEHRNPYSPEVTDEIQRGFYGRNIDTSKRGEPRNVEAFAYPIYVVFLMAPLLAWSFEAARVVFRDVLVIAAIASFWLWMRALGLQWWPFQQWLAVIVTMSSFAVVDGLHLQQITLLVAALMAGAVAALVSGRLGLAGVLLALATVKPQLCAMVVAFLFLWTLGEWGARRRFVIGFGIAMVGLLAGAEILMPGWVRFWWREAGAYVGYHKPSLMASLLGQRAGVVVGSAVIFLCGLLFWISRMDGAGSARFNFCLVGGLVVTLLLLPNAGGAYYNQVLLIPAALWLSTEGRLMAASRGLARLLWWIAAGSLALEWVVALAVSIAALAMRVKFGSEASVFVAGPEFLVFFFPLALALFVLSVAPKVSRGSESETPQEL